MFTRDSVTVITAATGHKNLLKCISSIQQQTYPQVEHLIVADGPAHEPKIRKAILGVSDFRRNVHLQTLPQPTGLQNWNGHRIYGAMSFLVNSEFLCFLDEDNWLDPDHIESLISCIQTSQSQWGFSLRKIVDGDGRFIALDNCESLGDLHPIFCAEGVFHVDLNCYMLRRDVAVASSPVLYRPTRDRTAPEVDTVLCEVLRKNFPALCSNLKHSVNYAVGNRPDSVRAEFFLHGNRVMQQKYPQGLPWTRKLP